MTDELWARLEPLLQVCPRRFKHPGRRRADDRAALEGILWVLRTGVGWNRVPTPLFGASGATCWRRLGARRAPPGPRRSPWCRPSPSPGAAGRTYPARRPAPSGARQCESAVRRESEPVAHLLQDRLERSGPPCLHQPLRKLPGVADPVVCHGALATPEPGRPAQFDQLLGPGHRQQHPDPGRPTRPPGPRRQDPPAAAPPTARQLPSPRAPGPAPPAQRPPSGLLRHSSCVGDARNSRAATVDNAASPPTPRRCNRPRTPSGGRGAASVERRGTRPGLPQDVLVSDLADSVLPLIRTRTDLHR